MVRNHYKGGQLIETADEHAKRLIDKRKASGKTGLPKAVKRYYKRVRKA